MEIIANKMKIELVSKTIGCGSYSDISSEEIIAAVARHGKIKDDNGRLVRYLMDNKHLSPLQHIFFSFKIETSRAISAQIFRHRSLNFQETSQRYENIQEIESVELRKQHPINRQSSTEVFDPGLEIKSGMYEGMSDSNYKDYVDSWGDSASNIIDAHIERTHYIYNKLIEAGVAKECARMILPMCSKTTIHVSGTFRDLLAFLNIRCEEHAQKEVRDIANKMGEILEQEMPEVMGRIDWRNGLFL